MFESTPRRKVAVNVRLKCPPFGLQGPRGLSVGSTGESFGTGIRSTEKYLQVPVDGVTNDRVSKTSEIVGECDVLKRKTY